MGQNRVLPELRYNRDVARRAEWNPELRSIAFGTLDNPSRIKPPQWAIYGRSAIPWIAHPRNIDVYDTNPYINEGEQPKRSS